MARKDPRTDMARKEIVYRPPGVDDLLVHKDIHYRLADDGPLALDMYCPPAAARADRLPAVIFVFGYPDAAAQAASGCKLKEMGAYISWARAVAAAGMGAITYEVKEPAQDICELLAYIHQNASSLGIDEDKIGIWSCSGNVPVALSLLMQTNSAGFKCAVFYYGWMLDCAGSNRVAEAARTIGFANPCVGKTIDDLPRDLPLLIVRAGRDNPGLNEAIDRFLTEAVARNLPTAFINYPNGVHAFDILDDSRASREIISRTLAFMHAHLLQ